MNTSSLATMAFLILAVDASSASAQQPVTLTSTADFQKGNNEGLIVTAQDRVTRARVSAATTGAWSATSSVSSGRRFLGSVVYNGFIYAIGGEYQTAAGGNSWTTDVLVAPINANGSLGSWVATTPLPAPRFYLAAVAYNGFIYVIGGSPGGLANGQATVWVAAINNDGSVGNWMTTTPLPSGRVSHNSIVHNGFVYCISGYNYDAATGVFGPLDEVLFAPVNADGSIGAWTATTSLPSARGFCSSFVYNGFAYVSGGDEGLYPLTEVLVAPLGADGSIGAWTATASVPSPNPPAQWGVELHSCVTSNGFAYSLGGASYDSADNWGPVSDPLVGSINPNGTVSAWGALPSFSLDRYGNSSVAHNGFLYSIGGFNSGTWINEVVYASIDEDSANNNQSPARLRGIYSHLVDSQGDLSTRWVVMNGQLSPGGSIRLQVRIAPAATGVLGAETVFDNVQLGAAIEIPGNGRFVWIRLTLDDTETTDVSQPTFISDITIGLGPSAGVVLDGTGADIDSQASNSTIQANWSGFTAAGSDAIASYQWAIGTAPGLTNVQNWTSVGLSTTATNSSLSLTTGTKFVSVRAISNSGLPSAIATSDGVQVLPAPAPPSSGGDDDSKNWCGQSAGSHAGSLTAQLAGLIILAWALRRRICR